jgi:ribose-phosphate pyrophosphokinase
MQNGAKSVVACAIHAVLSGSVVARIIDSPLSEVIVINSIPLSVEVAECGKIRVVLIARFIGEVIRRIHHSDSISSFFV